MLKRAGVDAGRKRIMWVPLLEGISQACATVEGATNHMDPAAVSITRYEFQDPLPLQHHLAEP